jgi:hypothetical protein
MSKRKRGDIVATFTAFSAVNPLKEAIERLSAKCKVGVSYPLLHDDAGFTFAGESKFIQKKNKLIFTGSGKLTWKNPLGTAIYDAEWENENIHVRQVIKYETLSYTIIEGEYQLKIRDKIIPDVAFENDDLCEPMLIIDQKGLRTTFPLAADHKGDVRTKIHSNPDLYLEWEIGNYTATNLFHPESITHLFGKLQSNSRIWMALVDPEKVLLLHIPSGSLCRFERVFFWPFFEDPEKQKLLGDTLDKTIIVNKNKINSNNFNISYFLSVT